MHTATYDVAVASWMGSVLTDTTDGTGFPAWVGATWDKAAVLRYGENPHQPAALYRAARRGGLGRRGAAARQGDVLQQLRRRRRRPPGRATTSTEPAVAIIKHANPCGIAVGADVAEAHRKAHACDPVSAFGGVIATNRPVSVAMAEQVAEIFTEVVVAPGLRGRRRRGAGRARRTSGCCAAPADGTATAVEFRGISGGLLMQRVDHVDAPTAATTRRPGRSPPARPPSAEQLADLAFAWKACRAVKSNAILLAADGASVGVGMGQVNRVDSCRLAVERAGDRAAGSVAASDAFFPFADGPQILVDAGVTRDRAARRVGARRGGRRRRSKAAGVTMYLTGTRHFFH